jgi:hypothetical protein
MENFVSTLSAVIHHFRLGEMGAKISGFITSEYKIFIFVT